MEKVGVEAVVEGLQDFLGGMNKMDSSIQGLIPSTGLLGKAFDGLGNILSGFSDFIANTLAYALGEILADAVQWVVTQISELVSATIEAGSEFQTLELRLQRLNFNSLVESGMDLNDAQTKSIELTKEQFAWLQKLAATTPYDNQDIANVFTLARSYGFAATEAQDLTKDITSFAAGMGLGNVEIERIIVNFGQMVQQGKVTQREMNDLARGAFVPVNDILQRMQENVGLTGAEFDKFKTSTEGVNAFMTAFSQIVEERFQGAAQNMARTFQGATANLKDFVKSIIGFNVVKPILDVVGGRVAEFMDNLTSETRWDQFTSVATKIGDSLSNIVRKILDLAPSASSFSVMILDSLTNVSEWLDVHSDDIVDWVRNVVDWVSNFLVPAFTGFVNWLSGDGLALLEKVGSWFMNDFLPVLKDVASWIGTVLVPFIRDDLIPVFIALLPLAGAIGDVLVTAFGGEPNQSLSDWIHKDLIPGIEKLTQWIKDNKDEIALWIERLAKLAIILEVAGWIAKLMFGVILFVGSIVLAIATLVTFWEAFVVGIIVLTAAIIGLIYGVVIGIFISGFITAFEIVKQKFLEFYTNSNSTIRSLIDDFVRAGPQIIGGLINGILMGLGPLGQIIISIGNMMQRAITTDINWWEVGRNIIMGIVGGIFSNVTLLQTAMSTAINGALTTAKTVLKMRSPSQVTWEFGELTMEGFSQGILSNIPMLQKAMQSAMGAMVMPAAAAPQMMASAASQTTNNSSTNNYFSQTVNTNANHEPVIADFNMMSSLAGG